MTPEVSALLVQSMSMLMPVLTLALTALVTYGVAFLRQKVTQVKGQMAQDVLYAALAEAEKVARDAVMATSQTFADTLKAASEDGKLTSGEAKAAMEQAKTYFLKHMTTDGIKVLQATLGPIDVWLKDYIEAKLYETKFPATNPQ
jgi:hypothetical protein